MPRDESAVLLSTTQCFNGLYFSTCVMVDQYDDDALFMSALPYYRNFNDFFGLTYCLQCCGGDTDIDYWNLRCETSDGGPVTNMYGYEARFARNKFPGDTELIYCPIHRSACTFNETTQQDECVEKIVRNDKTYLHGITIELHVKMMYHAQNAWRQVLSCNITADERNYTLPIGSQFAENYIMHHEIGSYSLDTLSYLLLLLVSVVLVYAVLYYCRRQKCHVCQKKLVFFKDRCYLCRFYGAHMPDPVLMKALEEKADHLQGVFPQRFWCSRRIVACCRGLASCVDRVSKCISYTCCCQCCCCCCKPRGESCKMCCCNSFCCCLFWCDSAEEVHPDDAHTDNKQEVAVSRCEARKKEQKINPYLIKKHPYIIHKAVDHPHPPEPPAWIRQGVLDPSQSGGENDSMTISTKKTPLPPPESSSSDDDSESDSASGSSYS